MEQLIKNGAIHVHTAYSFYDAVSKIPDLVARAKEMGCPALEISDHGTAAGWLEFYGECRDKGIKPILGIEAYLKENLNVADGQEEAQEEDDVVCHFNIMAKDYEGYKWLSQAITDSYCNLSPKGTPLMDREILEKYFGPDGPGHGHVVATTACISGPVSARLLYNQKIDKLIAKQQKKADGAAEVPADYYEKAEALKDLDEKIPKLRTERAEMKKLANKKLTTREKKLEKLTGQAYEDEKELIEKDRELIQQAVDRVTELDNDIEMLSKRAKELRTDVKKGEAVLARRQTFADKIAELEALKKTDEEMYAEAKEALQWFVGNFGRNDMYVEVQYHGYENEDIAYPKSLQIAKELGVNFVAANDVHMVNKEDAKTRQLVRSMRFMKWEELRPADNEVYLKSDDELVESLSQIMSREDAEQAVGNVGKIIDSINFEIPDIKHYPKWPGNPEKDLLEYIRKGCIERYGENIPDSVKQAVNYEYQVIKKMGYCAYFCLVADFIRAAKENGDNSIEIGPGRGSAAGSVIAYVTGITELDPQKYGLMFERFLNPERVSMPDIDTDFSTNARAFSIDYVKEKYGNVTGIMTVGVFAAKKSIDYCAKVYAIEQGFDRLTFTPLADEMKKLIPDSPDAKLSDAKQFIEEKYKDNKTALAIYHNAQLVEGLPNQYGRHAAGIIIGDDTPLSQIAPIMRVVDSQTGEYAPAIQANMTQVEGDLGLLKMDFLGLNNLNVITNTMRMVTERTGRRIDPYNIPFEPEVFREIFAKGDTNFVFQFESEGMKKMLKNFAAKDPNGISFEDLIMLVAAYRPGPMQYLDGIIQVKQGVKSPSYDIPELEPILKETYGAIIYQEQVIKICTKLAGFSMAQADNVRRFMSKKKADKLAHEEQAFVYGDPDRNIPGCVANGIPEDKAKELFKQLMDFASYAFNKSHAALYAYVAYMTAYLKYHYPEEYLCASITEYPDKLTQLKNDCVAGVCEHGERHIKIYSPDVNNADVGFIPYQDGIMFGLGHIVGVSSSAEGIVEERKMCGPFESVEDFIERCRPDKKVIEGFTSAGAFNSFYQNRANLATYMLDYSAKHAEARKLAKKLEEVGDDEAAKIKAQGNLDLKLMELEAMSFPPEMDTPETVKEVLALEDKSLKMWVSGNPLDDYTPADFVGCTPIKDLELGRGKKVGGIISDKKDLATKSDGSPFAIFTLTDYTGSLDVMVPSRKYPDMKDAIEDGAVVILTGALNERDGNWQLLCDSINPNVEPSHKTTLYVAANDAVDVYQRVLPELRKHEDPKGHPFYVFDGEQGMKGTFKVNEDIENSLDVIRE